MDFPAAGIPVRVKKGLIFSIVIGITFLFAVAATGIIENKPPHSGIKDSAVDLKNQAIPAAGMKSGPKIDTWKMPLYFIANKGQVDKKARFYAKASRYTLWLTKEGLIFDSVKKENPKSQNTNPKASGGDSRLAASRQPSHSSTITTHSPSVSSVTSVAKTNRDVSRLLFVGANKNPEIEALEKAKLKVNYIRGNDKSKWLAAPTAMAVRYKSLYKNIDLQVYGIEKQIEYDWIVKPGANPADIRFQYEDVKGTRIDKEGSLLIETTFGELVHKKPYAYQVMKASGKKAVGIRQEGKEAKGRRQEVVARFKKVGENAYGFEVGEYDKNLELVIDPVVLAYSTYLGGVYEEFGTAIAVDDTGIIYMTGRTESGNFPIKNQYQGDQWQIDVFVTVIDLTQTGSAQLLYSTYLGGNNLDAGIDIKVDGNGYVYGVGDTYSTDFPTVNHYQTDLGNRDGFVFKIDPSQSGAASLVYSTYLGGNGIDSANGIAVDSSDYVYVTGLTESGDFPILNQYQGYQGITAAYVTKLDPTRSGVASLLYSTCLAGGWTQAGHEIAVDDSGYAYVVGQTASANFPTLNPCMVDPGDGPNIDDFFISKIDASQSGANSLLYSTYLGGNAGDVGVAIDVDSSGYVYVTGYTGSSDFPTVNAYQGSAGFNNTDVVVAKLDITQTGAAQLLYSTYLSGAGEDRGDSIAVDAGGYIYVTGYTKSGDFPTFNQYQGDQGGVDDGFVAKLDPTRSGTLSLLYSTYLGGSGNESCGGIDVDSFGNAYLTGGTGSVDFPTLNPYQGDQAGGDAFVAKISPGVPAVDTPTSAAVTSATATLGGNVSETGESAVTERGIYWSITNGFTPPGQGTKVSETGTWGTGTFILPVSGLPPGTTIYFKAFAANTAGSGYSAQASFTTPPEPPTVTTTTVTGITSSSADSGGDVTADGGATVTARGVCWNTGGTPTTADNTTNDGTGAGVFTSSITGLAPGATYYVRAYAVNSVGSGYGGEETFTTLPVVPTVTTDAVSAITPTTATGGGNITDNGGAAVTGRGVCWNTTGSPTTADSSTNDGTGAGAFPSSLTGLTPGATYYVRAYAVNSAGIGYGNQVSFTTLPVLPTVTTNAISAITPTTATGGGNVTNNGGAAVTARGLCWNTTGNPTTTDSNTTNGTGIGAFTGSITGLTPGATYYVRAYAVNSVGTAYGNQVSFTTAPVLPQIITNPVSAITPTTALGGGNVTNNGGAAVTARGVCWNTRPNPTTANAKTSDGSGSGAFSSYIRGLTPGTTYYVRAYAINSVGTAYGNQVLFTTSPIPPTVITDPVTLIDSTSASGGGTVTYDGGAEVTARGLCWNKTGAPTTADSYTIDGSDVGSFTGQITGLTRGSFYYIRAYAVNMAGAGYGSVRVLDMTSTKPIISGKVTANGEGLPGVTITFSGSGSTVTGSDGSYSHEVEDGWSGEAVPQKTGYTFFPASISYTNLSDDQTNQNYMAALPTNTQSYIIKGVVKTTGGMPLYGVTLTFSGAGSTKTLIDGSYAHRVPGGWNGTVTPSKISYKFEPGERSYPGVNGNLSGEDYEAESLYPVFTFVSGRVKNQAGQGIPDVLISFSNQAGSTMTVTDAGGYYIHAVEKDWQGTVTPIKKNYTFSPLYTQYPPVSDSLENRDYIASHIGFTLDIDARWKVQKTMAMEKGYGEITVTLKGTPNANSGRYVIYKKEEGGRYEPIAEIPKAEFESERTYIYNDLTINTDKIYAYKVEAFDTSDVLIQASPVDSIPDQPGDDPVEIFLISGRVTDVNGAALDRVVVTFSNNGGYAATNIDGNYYRLVNKGWSGTATPKKFGFSFEPGPTNFNNITADRVRDYRAEAQLPVVTGKITTAGGKGVGSVILSFSNGGRVSLTDTEGRYLQAVKNGWTGIVTPQKTGYEFTPAGLPFTAVHSPRSGGNFSAKAVQLYLSGKINLFTGGGFSGIEGVSLSFSNNGGTAKTVVGGQYEHKIERGWYGSVTPSKEGFLFMPASRASSYEDHEYAQDFTALFGSIDLGLQAEWVIGGTPFIKKEYLKVTLNVAITGDIPLSGYVIYRRTGSGYYEEIGRVSPTELQSGGSFEYNDKNVTPGETYYYKAAALHESGLSIKESNEAKI